jgi:hypothetical protein
MDTLDNDASPDAIALSDDDIYLAMKDIPGYLDITRNFQLERMYGHPGKSSYNRNGGHAAYRRGTSAPGGPFTGCAFLAATSALQLL